MNLTTFTDQNEFITGSVDFIANVCKSHAETVRISLSGGGTPRPIYEALSKRDNIDFKHVKFFQVDERYVPQSHVDSNYNMILQNLIQPLKNNLRAFHFFDTSLSIEKTIEKYKEELEEVRLQPFDLTILGIGADGHFASLFPNSDALNEDEKLAIHTETDEHAIHDRLTITLPVILASKKILLLVSGPEKQKVLNDLIHSMKTVEELPAKALLSHNDLNIYYLNK